MKNSYSSLFIVLAGFLFFMTVTQSLYGQTLVCPSNITVNTQANSCGAVVNYAGPQGSNLLANPQGNSPANIGWNILTSTEEGINGSGNGFGQLPGLGFAATFTRTCSSNGLHRKAQTIDLLNKGYTAAFLDASPQINISETFRTVTFNSFTLCFNGYTPNNFLDKYYLKVELRNAANQTIATINFGTPAAPLDAPLEGITQSHTFSGYPAGVRYIYFEDGGLDTGAWGGFFGTQMENASVSIASPFTQTGGLPSGSVFPVGTTTNTFVATIGGTCQFTVTVQDQELPAITCPVNPTITTNAACAGSIGSWTPITVSDNCSIATITQSPSASTVLNGHNATQTVTLRAFDVNGNNSACSFSVTLKDMTPPTAQCRDISVALVGNTATITPAQINNGSSDNCSANLNLSASLTTFDCSHSGQIIPVQLTVTDEASNSATCMSNVTVTGAATIYVNQAATGANNGASWANAYTDLQSALAAACPGSEIWVAAGIYKPTSGTDRTISFVMKNSVAIYGGFPNSGNPGWANRNWNTHVTTLSGNIGVPGKDDNTYHVIRNTTNQLNATAILDGFIISDGNASAPTGIPSQGGGIHNRNSSPTIRNCVIQHNSSRVNGGGIYNRLSSANIVNCIFKANECFQVGTAISNEEASPVIINCSFFGNTTGPAISNSFSNSQIYNCIIWGNTSGIGSYNSTITVTHSIVQGEYAGTGNLNIDPLFVNALGGDFRLQNCSPAINAGNNTAVPAGLTTDFDGNSRFFNNAIVDMGAYEFQGSHPNPIPVCQNITVQLSADNTVTVLAAQLSNGSTGCGNLTYLINGQPSLVFGCNDLGTPQNVTLTVTDTYNSTATCQATITIADDVNPCCAAPEAVCKPFTAMLNGTQVVVTPADVNNGSTADCGLQSITVSPNTFNCSQVGLQTVMLTVTDINGESDACQATVTVVDQTPPTITCPATQTLALDVNCGATLPNYTSLATTSDNCGVQSVTQSPVAGTSVSGAGNLTVTLTVTDLNNLTTSCTFTVTKMDNTAPTITCPATQTLALGANCTATLPNYTSLATTGDNCGVQSVTQSPTAGTSVSGAGNMTVTLTVTDLNGLTNICTFTVTKIDNTAPSITCPATQTLALGANCTATLPNYTSLATTSDNCGVQSITQSPTAGTTVSSAGNLTITLTVTDVNNLTTSCTFTVNKMDNTAPTIACPATQTLALGANCGATLPNYTTLATTGDNCGVQSVTQSPTAGTTVSNAGNLTVTLTVTDVNGVTNSCQFTVTKADQTPPTLVCKNTTVFIGNTGIYTLQPADVFDAIASSDNCSGALTVTNISPAMVSCAQLNQTIPITVTVQDASGNTATCTAQITVQEGTALPGGWSSANVGSANGDAGYKACSFDGSFTVAANGFSTSSADMLHFASGQLCGNGEIIARVMNVIGGGWAGVMLRESLAPGAKKVTLKTQLTSMIRREIRSVMNGATSMLNLNRPQHVWLRLVRSGSNVIGYTSISGLSWDFAFSTTISMTGCIYAGVFAESINATTTTTASFSNVSIIGGVAPLVAPDHVGDVPFAAPDFEVYPNPTTGEVTVNLRAYADQPVRLELYDIQGKILKALTMERTETMNINLDLSTYQNGIYLVRVRAAGAENFQPLRPDATKRIVLNR